ncbi:MAG: indolepyruvate oxidoreductase subunit beta family protein [Immundisolibacteraceae bacterium]|nr:indolepyruvate oxidoreductase subunit beta family protein [Immundisolibacteraceae bacterium]
MTIDNSKRGVRVLIGTVGGQGGGVLSDWLVRGLLNAGWQPQSIGLLGLSQRAGTVIYYVEANPEGDTPPILSPFAVPGDVDLILAQEFLELGRLLQGGFAAKDCTIIANTYRYLGTLEKMPAEGGIFSSDEIQNAAETLSDNSWLFHAQNMVTEAGLSYLSSNAILMGAVVASPAFNLPAEPFQRAIRDAGSNVEDNIKAFDLGYQMMSDGTLPRAHFQQAEVKDWQQMTDERAEKLSTAQARQYRELLATAQQALPAALNQTLAEALYQLIDFQHVAYAKDYLRMLAEFRDDEPLLAVYAQHLALWLTYEDSPRVAQLKTRPSRFTGIAKEHGLKPGQKILIEDYLAPDPQQIYGILPPTLANLVRSMGKRLNPDFENITLEMKIKTSSLWGYYTMAFIGWTRRFRLRSWRHQQEMNEINGWQQAIRDWRDQAPELAVLAADAGRLIKGYGRVRDLALADLNLFLKDALPLLKSIADNNGDALAIGKKALATAASEAGKGAAGVAVLQAELETLVQPSVA